MTLDKDKKILIVGLGLIGGSYAAALSQNGWEVGAIDPDPQAIAFAEKAGFIRHGRTEPEAEYVGKFDIVVFALYPHVLVLIGEIGGQFVLVGVITFGKIPFALCGERLYV